jgi:hypothetical protein
LVNGQDRDILDRIVRSIAEQLPSGGQAENGIAAA